MIKAAAKKNWLSSARKVKARFPRSVLAVGDLCDACDKKVQLSEEPAS